MKSYKTLMEFMNDEGNRPPVTACSLVWKLGESPEKGDWRHGACFGDFRGKVVHENDPLFHMYLVDIFSAKGTIENEASVIDQYLSKLQEMGFNFSVSNISDNHAYPRLKNQCYYQEKISPMIEKAVTFDLSKVSARELFVAGTLIRYIYEYPLNVEWFFKLEEKHPESTSFQNLLAAGMFSYQNGHTLPCQWARYLIEKDVKEYLSKYPIPYIKMNNWSVNGDGSEERRANPVSVSLAHHEYVRGHEMKQMYNYDAEMYQAFLCEENYLKSRFNK